MTFEKFVYLLNDGLFCPKSSLFEDQWEGLLTNPRKREDSLYIRNFEKAREWIYVSCWHTEAAESYAIWKIYGEHQYSLCIQATTDRIEKLFRDYELAPAIYSCRVVYGNPNEKIQTPALSNLRESQDIFEKGIWKYADDHSVKHEAYLFEAEYRIIIIDNKFNLETKNRLHGLTLKINPNEIIDAIIVSPRAPDWFYKIVSDTSAKYGLPLKIEKSYLDRSS